MIGREERGLEKCKACMSRLSIVKEQKVSRFLDSIHDALDEIVLVWYLMSSTQSTHRVHILYRLQSVRLQSATKHGRVPETKKASMHCTCYRTLEKHIKCYRTLK